MLYLSAFALFSVVHSHAQVPIVETTEGKVEGVKAKDGDYFIYYGIPYAGAPIRSYRFKAPIPPPQHADILYADDSNITCARWEYGLGMIGSEDCLRLHIHTKNVSSLFPVIVIVLGEEYFNIPNPSTYSMKQFVDNDIVVVTVNYRLSVFGFLCLGVPEAPGNAGLKDILQSLRWIHYNINAFGGDRKNVMLFGHGSGAALVDLITLTPQSVNFVHKAITQSGSALAPWAMAYTPAACARRFAYRIYTGDSTIEEMTQQELARYLMKTTLYTLAAGYGESLSLDGSVLFSPCVENEALNGSLITKAPINILRSGDYNHIPYITGFTDKEGSVRIPEAVNGGWLVQLQRNFSKFMSLDLSFKNSWEKSHQGNIIKTLYFSNQPVNMETLTQFLEYIGDTLFVMPAIRGAKERALTSRAEVRVYEFAYGNINKTGLFVVLNGAEHGAVLDYLFNHDLSSASSVARDMLLKHYVLFAYTGQPTNSEMELWEAISKDRISLGGNIPYLQFTGRSTEQGTVNFEEKPKLDPHGDKRKLWDKIYEEYYVPPPAVQSSMKLLSCVIILALAQLVIQLL